MRPFIVLLAITSCIPVFTGHAGIAPVEVMGDEKVGTPQPAKDQFSAEIKPLVEKYCIVCHNNKKDSGGLNLTLFTDTASAMKQRDTWETVKRRLDMKEMPPKNKPHPSDDERKRMTAWIGAELAKAGPAPSSPGRVTLRRLNRVEYNRTIHDLTGVNLLPADEFPSDDVGHGFDNIGDVLSMPPLLLEKYLNAAERVVERMLTGEPAKPESRRYTARELTPTNDAELKERNGRSFRSLDTAGAVYVDHQVAQAGELTVRALAFGAPFPGDRKLEAVKFAFQLDGKEFSNQRLPTNTFTGVEAKVKVTSGKHRIALALLNPSDKDAKEDRRTLGVAGLEIISPIKVSTEKPASYKAVMIGESKDESRERADKILRRFAFRAYRRPVRPDEMARLLKLYDMARKDGESFDKSVALALQAVLVSPHFLFRVEPDRPAARPDGSYALNSWEIATRLSYFLWSTMPDDELFGLAEQGKLRDPAVLEAQVARMLKDPKSIALVQNFGMQWLNLRNLQLVQPSRRDFRAWDESLREAMQKETELFLAAVIAEDRGILDLLDADFTFVNERLARHYGISGVTGDAFQRVKLTDHNRGGILTQASVLTVTSNPTRTSPVKRGKWILENILGTPPPPPPPDVPELKEGREALKGTLRERMQQHRANPNCATCHERMDTIGFGLENFDAIGSWRTSDGSFKIDASGTLPDGKSFKTPAELKVILKSQEGEFRRCLTEKLMTYALGRGLEKADRPEVTRISAAVAADHSRFNRMVLEIVKSDAFLRRMVKR